ncbi:MAG: hypothetical protein OXT69_14720 [Candidatus Poribacteria bacterium]|nr:hypothetical protein [Candidatus Poribacteria bacterium]
MMRRPLHSAIIIETMKRSLGNERKGRETAMANWKKRFTRGRKKSGPSGPNWKLERSSEHISETIAESSTDGSFKGSATFEFKNFVGVEKIEMRTPYLSEFGGPIRGAVRIERHDSSDIRISMKGALESGNENEEGKKFFKQMTPKVKADGKTAALRHAFAELTELPEHIRSVSMDFEVRAPENVEIVLSEKASD